MSDHRTLGSESSAGAAGPASRGDRPAVIVLNLAYTGLGIARDLHGTGVKVVGMTAVRGMFGNFTRYCDVRIAPDSEREAEALRDYLVAAAGELGGAVIFPTRDLDIAFLDEYREPLSRHYRVGIPPRESLHTIMDKYALYRVAVDAGVPVPRSLVAKGRDDLRRVPEEIGFPCIIKPVKAIHWRGYGKWDKVGGQKAIPILDRDGLDAEYAKVAEVTTEVLVQELIPGESQQLASACTWIGPDSKPLAWFTAGIVLKYPDHLGTGCLVENRRIPEIEEPSFRLLHALGYHGMADVEYKQDPRDGQWKLIEINTRHWDWHQLGNASGVNVTRTAYTDLTGVPLPPVKPLGAGARWINEETFSFASARSIYWREKGIRDVLHEVSGPRMYGIFDPKDPLPFVCWTFNTFIPSAARQFAARRRRAREAARSRREAGGNSKA